MRNTEHNFSGASDCTAASHAETNTLTCTLASPERPLYGTPSDDFSALVAVLTEAAHRARGGDRDAATAHIAQAVELLVRKPIFGPRTPPISVGQRQVTATLLPAWQARRLIAHVNTNFARRICVAELAALLGLSTTHFARAFKHTFGVSPHAYLVRRRIENAQELMLTTNEPLSSIALSCGMCDQAHLTRCFKRIVGQTPYAWRRTRKSRHGELLSVEMEHRHGKEASLDREKQLASELVATS